LIDYSATNLAPDRIAADSLGGGAKMANHKQQGPPRRGVQDVTPLLIADLEARAAAGLATYGRPLQTHNGRNAAQDALEEALDLAQYLKQVVLEQEAAAVRWVKVVSPIVCWECGRLVIATNDDPVEVVLDDRDGSLAFFCSGGCANLPATGPAFVAPDEEREHQGTSPFVNAYGKQSSICLKCDVCGVGFDPTWETSRRGCPGPRSAGPVRFSAAMSDRPNDGS
jgi:hypothetical protein